MLGKAFTCVYALIGITVILKAISPFVAFMRGDWRDQLLKAIGCAPAVDTSDPNLTVAQVNAAISYPRRYALALIGPMFVFIAGIFIHFLVIRDPLTPAAPGLVDSVYWTVISMTTIGYGKAADGLG